MHLLVLRSLQLGVVGVAPLNRREVHSVPEFVGRMRERVGRDQPACLRVLMGLYWPRLVRPSLLNMAIASLLPLTEIVPPLHRIVVYHRGPRIMPALRAIDCEHCNVQADASTHQYP